MKKILIIEDDPKLALALSVRLKANGYATWIASDSVMALSMAVRMKPDLILLDICLPAGNGFDLIARFEEFEETRETPIILTTASKDPNLRTKSIDSGAAGLLRKPYEPEELLGIVEQVLDRWEVPEIIRVPLEQSAVESPTRSNFKKVLIVEDDENIASALSIRMGAAGFETTIARDGMSGVRTAVSLDPDLVILDISLPAGDGFSVAENIQANIPKPVRIIFLTASKREDFRERAQQLGAIGFFEKPYEPTALVSAVQQALC
jgi:DNA-binding response OmpR family regulator